MEVTNARARALSQSTGALDHLPELPLTAEVSYSYTLCFVNVLVLDRV